MRVAVLGSTGFVGKAVIRALTARGIAFETFAPDGAGTTHRWDSLHAPSAEVAAELRRCDVVCYLAAHIPADYDAPAEAERCMQINALGVLKILSTIREDAQFIYTSSAALYGSLPGAASEDSPVYPSRRATYYLASKLAGELYVGAAAQRGQSTAILRLASVYGPGSTKGSAISLFATRFREGKEIVLNGGGRFSADLVHVDDVAIAIVACAERRCRGIFNVGSGVSTSMHDAAYALASAFNAPTSQIRMVDADQATAAGIAALDISRARDVLGYAPRSFSEGAAGAANW